MNAPIGTALVHSQKLAELMQATAYQLADMAGVTRTGSGAGDRFLLNVRDAWADELINERGLPQDIDDDSRAWEQICDDAPSVYTARKWEEFTDLCAWDIDIDDYVDESTSMDNRASFALYRIAEFLLQALDAEMREDDDIVARIEFYEQLDANSWEIVIPELDLVDTYALVNSDDTVMGYFTAEQFFEGPLDVLAILVPTN
jgi:hypothetical protein